VRDMTDEEMVSTHSIVSRNEKAFEIGKCKVLQDEERERERSLCFARLCIDWLISFEYRTAKIRELLL